MGLLAQKLPYHPYAQEVIDATRQVGYDPAEVRALFDEADINNDHAISFEEFIQLMRHSYIS